MSAEDELLQRIADQLDRDAPPISIDEIEHRTPLISLHPDNRPGRVPRRISTVVLAVAAVTSLTVGLGVLLAQRSPARTVRTGSTAVIDDVTPPTEPATTPSTSPAVPLDPTTTTPVDESVPSNLDATDADAGAIAEIDADRVSHLRTLAGFSATVRQETLILDTDGTAIETQPGRDSRVTLLADGSMWADFASGGFASYDPATGQSRGAFTNEDGTTMYQLIEGWTENSTGLNILLGHDPAQLLTETATWSSIDISSTTHDGRRAWRVESTANARSMPYEQSGSSPQTSTFIIDQETGLIVSSSVEWQATAEQRHRQSSELIDLEIVAALPEEFPGTFPDGAAVDRSGDPNAFRPASLQEAADWFGSGFVAPTDVPPSTRIFLTEQDLQFDDGESVRLRMVEIRAREGFVTPWQFTISKQELAPGAPIPESFAVVDGALCPDSDHDDQCDVIANEVAPIEQGALAGYVLSGDPSYLSLERAGIRITIVGDSPSEFRPLVESFVAW